VDDCKGVGAQQARPCNFNQERNFIMKRIFAITTFITLLLALAACTYNRDSGTLRGTGPMVSRDFDISDFNGISINGPFVIIYRESETYAVRVEMQENLLERTSVVGISGMLRVETSIGFTIARGNTPRVYVYAPYLNTISLHTATSTYDWDTIYSETLIMYVSGASSATIDMEVERVEIRASGAASFTLSGTAEELYVDISGAGSVSAQELQVKAAEIHITGAGSATVAASDTLYVSIAGVGNVTYHGNPTVTRNISGVGTVRRAE